VIIDINTNRRLGLMKIASIIPARGGSKQIPRKNIVHVKGRPLISYTIEAAKKSRYIDRVAVSTDDEEIATISEGFGAEIIKRPKEYAMDDSPTIDVVLHGLDELEKQGYVPDGIVTLQPTSPLRTSEDIDTASEIFINSNCTSVVSVCETEHSPSWMFTVENGHLNPLFDRDSFSIRRQDFNKIFRPNGAIYISTPKNLREFHGFYPDKTLPYIMKQENSVDIDTHLDLKLVELIMGVCECKE